VEYYTTKELKEKLGFSDPLLVKKIIVEKWFDVKEIYIGNKIRYLFEKTKVDKYINERNEKYTLFNDVVKSYNIKYERLSRLIKLRIISGKKDEFSKKMYVYNDDISKISDIDSIKLKYPCEKLDIDDELIKRNYYSINEISSKYKISTRNIRISISRGMVKAYKKGSFKYVLKADIDNYFNDLKKNYISTQKAITKYGIDESVLRNHIILKDIKTYNKHLFDTVCVYLYIPDVEKVNESYKKRRLIKSETKIENKTELIFNNTEYKKFPNTFREFKNYVKYAIDNSNRTNKNIYLKLLYRSYEKLAKLLKKEMLEYSNNELVYLFQRDEMMIENKRQIGYFLRYCIQEMPNQCRFTEYPKVYSKVVGKLEKDAYDKKTWTKYFEILTNIDLHIIKAFKDDRYSNIWLFSLLHFSLMWRKADILKIPLFTLPINNIDNIN
jgi:3-methyladenine DNA glycosylase Tag